MVWFNHRVIQGRQFPPKLGIPPLPSPAFLSLPPVFSLSPSSPLLSPSHPPCPSIPNPRSLTPNPAIGLGERCKLSSGVRGGRQRVYLYFRLGNRRSWWRLSVVVKRDSRPVCTRLHSNSLYGRLQHLPNNWSSPLWDGPYRPQKWSCPDPRSGWKSTSLWLTMVWLMVNHG